jgi:hypothetical protein
MEKAAKEPLPPSREERIRLAVSRLAGQVIDRAAGLWPASNEEANRADSEDPALDAPQPLSRYIKEKGVWVYAYVSKVTVEAPGRFVSLKEHLGDPESPERQKIEDLRSKMGLLGSLALDATIQRRSVFVGFVRDNLPKGKGHIKSIGADLYMARVSDGEGSTSTIFGVVPDKSNDFSDEELQLLEDSALIIANSPGSSGQ